MPPAQRNNKDVIVIEDLWAELGIARPSIPLNPLPNVPLRFSRPWQLSFTALVLTVLLHILLGLGLFADFGGIKAQSTAVSTGGPAAQSTTSGVVSVLILLNDQSDQPQVDAKPQEDMQATTDVTEAVEPVAVEPPVQPSVAEGASAVASAASGSGAQPRTLQDIYMGQIKARVERAWGESQGTRMVVGNCAVNITQGKQGEVMQVNFGRCFATAAWKATLAQAIRFASPLPAPPEEKVFSEEISLEF